MSKSFVQALGVSFHNGDLSDACVLAKRGGLITAPSGPGLAQDLTGCPEYRRALELSDLVLADSGLLCLWKKWVEKKPLSRISGLVFLQCILNSIDWRKKDTFWVMPDEDQANTVMNFYLENHPHDGPYSVRKVQIYSVKGLGRDPDLH